MFRWKIKQCRRTESNQKWGNYTNYLGWSETSTLIRWHLNRNFSTVKEQAKQIPREEATSGTALPLRGNGVGAWVQYLINSKEQLWLEGGKGEMIMKLERCWRPDDERAELSGSPRNLCVPPKRPASDFPQHPNSPLHCLPQDHQESSHRTPFPYHTCPYKKTKTHSLGSIPHMVIHIMFSDLTCYFPPSPFKILLLSPLKLESIANKTSCTLSLICECSLHLTQTKTWISWNDTFFPVILWNVAALSYQLPASYWTLK